MIRKQIHVFFLLFTMSYSSMMPLSAMSSDLIDSTDKKVSFTLETLSYLKLVNTWLHTSNPAGLSLARMMDLGESHFSFFNNHGDYYRPQEAQKTNRGGFFSQRYQRLKSLHFKGDFSFQTIQERSRRWGDVLDPYRGTPYVFADAEGGDWAKQSYSLGVTASTEKLLNLFYAGLSLNYELNTSARQNDPRPLNNTNLIEVRPGFIFPLGQKSHVGMSGFLSNRNEEISITVVNMDVQHRWYKLRGVGEYRTGFMQGFFRAYTGDGLGGGLSYEYKLSGGSILAEVNYTRFQEEVTDGTSTVQHGGEYREGILNSNLSVKFESPGQLHLVRGFFNMIERKGIEHNQSYDNVQEIWVTFATSLRFSGDIMQTGINYDFVKTRETGDYNWKTGFEATFAQTDLRFLLPQSTQLNSDLFVRISGKKNVLILGTGIHLGLSVGYKHSLMDELSIDQELLTGDRSIIVDNITNPDFLYLQSSYAILGIDATWNFRFSGVPFYLNLNSSRYQLTGSETSGSFGSGNRNFLELRLGMVY
jgi:hypothetical protein